MEVMLAGEQRGGTFLFPAPAFRPWSMNRLGSSLLVLYVASGAVQAVMNMVFLAFPLYALEIGASPFEIGLMGAVGGLSYSLMARLLGGLSDRYSKVDFIVLGTLTQAIIPAMHPLCSNTAQLTILRIAQAFGLALFWPAIEASVAASTRHRSMEKALVGYNVSWSAASIVGPPVSGFLITVFSISAPFYFSSAVALSALIMLMLLRNMDRYDSATIPIVHHPITGKRSHSGLMLLATIAAFAYAFNLGIVGTLFPVLATNLGVSAFQIGLLFLLSNLAQTLVFVFSESLLKRFGDRSFLIGAAVFAVSLTLIAFVEDSVAFAAPLIGLGVAQGLLYSSSLFYLLRESGSSPGHVTGRFESVLGLASFLGPFLGGVVAQYSSKYPYLAGALLSVLVILIQMLLVRASCHTLNRVQPGE